MAKCMEPLCHMGRWNGCEGDTWKPCVTKMENEKKKERNENSIKWKKCDQFIEEEQNGKERNKRKEKEKKRKERKKRKEIEKREKERERKGEEQLPDLGLHYKR